MTTERIADDNGDELEHGEPDFPGQFPETTVSLGSCPTCRGPAQFVVPEGATHASGCSFEREGLCNCSAPDVRHVDLPNIDEDLGDGWRLIGIDPVRRAKGRWAARAERRRPSSGIDVEYGFAESPLQAYLALRTAIENLR